MPNLPSIQAPIQPPPPLLTEKQGSSSAPPLKSPESLFPQQQPDQHINTTKQAKAIEEVFFVDQTETTELPKTILQTDSKNPQQQLNLKPGTRVAIEVNSNVSTGYSWQIDSGNIPTEELYVPDYKGEGFPPPGSGGRSYYVFTVPEHGKIELTHGQAWDKDSQQKYVFNINE